MKIISEEPNGEAIFSMNTLLLLSLLTGKTSNQGKRPRFLKNLGHLTAASMAIPKGLETVRCVIGGNLPSV